MNADNTVSLTLTAFSDTLAVGMNVFAIIFLLLVALPASAQVRSPAVQPRANLLLKPQPETNQSEGTALLFRTIERGILDGSSETLHPLFARQVSMTVSGDESGYYSAGQASLILQSFFSTRKPTQFSFTRTNTAAMSPYATGRLTFIRRGTKGSVQVYISLVRQDSQWVISQFNIY